MLIEEYICWKDMLAETVSDRIAEENQMAGSLTKQQGCFMAMRLRMTNAEIGMEFAQEEQC